MNLQLFEPHKDIHKYINKILNNSPFFLNCKNCFNVPEVILKDNKYIIINCPNCNIIENENLDNLTNYTSKWITNEINNYCNFNHDEKIISSLYCRECNKFFCINCRKNHSNKYHNHDIIKIKDLKIGFCHQHYNKYNHYCDICKFEMCEICKNYHEHKNKIKKGLSDYINMNKFEIFLIKAEETKKEKYLIISKTKTLLENIFTEDRESYILLKNIISEIIKEFYKDLKTEQNLIYFAQILIATIKKINNYNDFRVKQYKQILEVIYELFDSNEVEKFNKFINTKKYIYKSYINKLSNDEENMIKNNLINILNINNFNNNDEFNKIKYFIKNALELSNPLKKYILIDKIKNINSHINIEEIINNPSNITHKINSRENSSLILSILCKFFQQKGIEMHVTSKKNEDFKNIDIASFIAFISLGNIKKYELLFDFGQEFNSIFNYLSEEEKNRYLNDIKLKISQLLNIDSNYIIIIFKESNKDSIIVNISLLNNIHINNEDFISKLKNLNFLKKLEEKPIFETILLNSELLDKRGDKIWKKNKNEIRGGYDYIQPNKDWIGIGLKIHDKFDRGNNTWLGKKNLEGEYAVAYSGLNFIFFNNNLKNGTKKIIPKNIDKIVLYQDPKLAENNAGIINVFGYKIMIMLMFRVNPNKINKSLKNNNCWIFNPTPDEIRPYRILLKIIPSLLTDKINISFSPIDYIITAFKSKNISFYNLAKDKRFLHMSKLNNQNINQDFFTMRFYSSNYYYLLNNYLRSENSLEENNDTFNKSLITSWIYCLQLALQRNKNVLDNIIVYRGIKGFKFRKDIKKGTEFYFREFISTSLDKNVAKNFLGGNGTLMTIIIKNNGSNGYPNYCYNIKDISLYPHEDEILISSHCCFEVNDIIKSKKIDEVYLTCKGFKIN